MLVVFVLDKKSNTAPPLAPSQEVKHDIYRII